MSLDDKILNGKSLSIKFLTKVRQEIAKKFYKVGLAAILVDNDPSSELYVKLKKRACEKCDVDFHLYRFDSSNSEQDIIDTIKFLNDDPETTGILVQLPLPERFDTDKILNAMDYRKDIDGFHPKNRADMEKCVYKILPPLPLGIIELVNSTKETIENKSITILCNHKLFGDPFKCVWGNKNTVNVITTEDKGWKQFIAEADILIVSLGLPFFITKDMIKDGCTIIDVGINKLDNGEVVGDVNIADVIDKVAYISPVPGGVGPMTIAMLLKNLLTLAKK